MAYKCKTPVVLIFFNRPDTFGKVFEKVRKAQPDNLILVQDGPRNENDKEAIMECRRIAESVDWSCNVIKDYSEVNLGCGVRPQSGIKKALDIFDRVIILEDDCIPNDSFFRYCDELLEKYKDDDRIAYISGLNHFETWDCGEQDYFFTKTGAIWGWATWANKWNKYYDYYVSGVNDNYLMNLIEKQFPFKDVAKSRKATWVRANYSRENGEKLSYWDNQWGFVKYSQNMLVITPSVNQICNIGVGITSTHAQSQTNTRFKKNKNFFYIPTHDINFPMKHPKYVICDVVYDDSVYKVGRVNPVRKIVSPIVKKVIRRKNNDG
ncbi:MAG: glycosyltransferase family 2 protein [Lachnospiraceae bacterium]|nr:glycosyltransferase family 2 protein [Lachnospiraceae bacterium]